MFAITIDDKKVRDKYGKIRSNITRSMQNFPYEVAQFYEEFIRDEASMAFSFPTGETEKSIKAVKLKDGEAAIKAVDTAWFTDIGRGPTRKPSADFASFASLDLWAERAGINKYALAIHISKEGTSPRPFIRLGISQANARMKQLLENETMKIVS